jgi:hypothetical protein
MQGSLYSLGRLESPLRSIAISIRNGSNLVLPNFVCLFERGVSWRLRWILTGVSPWARWKAAYLRADLASAHRWLGWVHADRTHVEVSHGVHPQALQRDPGGADGTKGCFLAWRLELSQRCCNNAVGCRQQTRHSCYRAGQACCNSPRAQPTTFTRFTRACLDLGPKTKYIKLDSLTLSTASLLDETFKPAPDIGADCILKTQDPAQPRLGISPYILACQSTMSSDHTTFEDSLQLYVFGYELGIETLVERIGGH